MRALRFLRLVDEDGDLSLTHLACFLAFYCMVRGVPVSWTDMGGFLIAMASYRVKRGLEDKANTNAVVDRMQVVEEKVAKMASPERLNQLAQAMRPNAR